MSNPRYFYKVILVCFLNEYLSSIVQYVVTLLFYLRMEYLG